MGRCSVHGLALVKAAPNQRAWNKGELSPLLDNRADYEGYANGSRRMRNFLPTPQGPARKRPGLRFVAQTAGNARAWQYEFVFAADDAVVLEFTSGKLRFYADHGQILEAAKTITALTNATSGQITSAAHGFFNGQEVFITAVAGMTQVNGRNFLVANVTANTFTLVDPFTGANINTTAYGAYTSGGTVARVYELATVWTDAYLTRSDGTFGLSLTQSNDVMYICVAGIHTKKLTRLAANNWTLTDFSPAGGPFKTVDPNQTITVYSGAETGATTLTASAAIFTADHVGALFLLERNLTDVSTAWEVGKGVSANDVLRSQGHYYKALNAATTGSIIPTHTAGARYDGVGGGTGVNWQYLHSGYGWALITGYTSATVVAVAILSRIPAGALAATPSTQWAFGAWSTVEGWPTHVTFFRQRLTFLRRTQGWFSVPADFETFAERDAGDVTPDSAISIDFRQGTNDDTLWIYAASDLLVGTGGGEFAIGEISTTSALSPGNVAAIPGPGYASRQVRPVKVNNGVLHVSATGRKVRELNFDAQNYYVASGKYLSTDLTGNSDHIIKGQVVQMAYAREPDSLVWSACHNGDLAALTYDPMPPFGVTAWTKQPPGGSALVETVCSIPSPDGTHNELWLSAAIVIGGTTRHYTCYLDPYWDYDEENGDAIEDAFYVDFGLTYSGASASVISGLYHLEGASVMAFADGRKQGPYTVSGGSITLGSAASKVHIGLAYTGILQTMKMEAGAQDGTAQAKIKRITKAFIRVVRSLFGSAGPATDDVKPLRPKVGVDLTNTPFTGDIEHPWGGTYEKDGYITIIHDDPTPFLITGIMPDVVTQDRG